MFWLIIALVVFIVGCYVILTNNTEIKKKSFSLLSLLVFALLVVTLWNDQVFVFMLNISLFLPFLIGLLGIIFSWLGIKGYIRIGLIGLNIVILLLYFTGFLIGIVGFSNP